MVERATENNLSGGWSRRSERLTWSTTPLPLSMDPPKGWWTVKRNGIPVRHSRQGKVRAICDRS
jgi:hypothetical protein